MNKPPNRTTTFQRLAASLGPFVIGYRWWIIFATTVVVAFVSSGTRFLSFNMDNRIFFSKDNPQLAALEALENTYVKNYNVLFVLAPKGKDIFEQAGWKTTAFFPHGTAGKGCCLELNSLSLGMFRKISTTLKRCKDFITFFTRQFFCLVRFVIDSYRFADTVQRRYFGFLSSVGSKVQKP